jgi:hypothetical protein
VGGDCAGDVGALSGYQDVRPDGPATRRGGHFVTRIPCLGEIAARGLALLGILIPTSGRTDADHLASRGMRVTK